MVSEYVDELGATRMTAPSGAIVEGTKAFDGNAAFQATLQFDAATLKTAALSAAARISLPFRLTAPVSPRPPPPASRMRSPLASTMIRARLAGRVPAFVVSQGPMLVPSSLAPMMNDRP